MLSLRFKNTIQTLTFLHNFNRPLLYSTKSPNQSFANYLVNSLGFSDEQALSTSGKVSSKNTNDFKSSDNANSVVAFLKQHGFDDTHIKELVSSHPFILSIDVDKTLIPYSRDTEVFRNILVRAEEEIGIRRDYAMFLYGMHLLCKSKCPLFKSFGWTEVEVYALMRRSPFAFNKPEEDLKKRLGFLMTELGYKPYFLVSHPKLFHYSLEKRMEPRRRVLLVLKEKGLLDCNFYTAITKTEKQFLKIYIELFKEDVPGLLELYQSSKGKTRHEIT